MALGKFTMEYKETPMNWKLESRENISFFTGAVSDHPLEQDWHPSQQVYVLQSYIIMMLNLRQCSKFTSAHSKLPRVNVKQRKYTNSPKNLKRSSCSLCFLHETQLAITLLREGS